MTQRNVEPCLGKLHDVGTLTSRQTGTKKKRSMGDRCTHGHREQEKKKQGNENN